MYAYESHRRVMGSLLMRSCFKTYAARLSYAASPDFKKSASLFSVALPHLCIIQHKLKVLSETSADARKIKPSQSHPCANLRCGRERVPGPRICPSASYC